jgi:hypothetical protein
MYGPVHEQVKTQPQFARSGVLPRINFRHASTGNVNTLLSELKSLPNSHRRLLCRLLRRAAAQAPRMVSVVYLAVTHHKMKL